MQIKLLQDSHNTLHKSDFSIIYTYIELTGCTLQVVLYRLLNFYFITLFYNFAIAFIVNYLGMVKNNLLYKTVPNIILRRSFQYKLRKTSKLKRKVGQNL